MEKSKPPIFKKSLLEILQVPAEYHEDISDFKTRNRIETKHETQLVVFTDGACSNNGSVRAKAGYGVVWPNNRDFDVSKRLYGSEQTNNRAEFMALIEAQTIADVIDPKQEKPLYVYTDSELLINSITKWLSGWKKNDWKKSNRKPVLNQDLLKKIDSNPRPLIFKHVRAHTGRKDWESIYNNEADRLAREGLGK
jgi:ribonuclease HI